VDEDVHLPPCVDVFSDGNEVKVNLNEISQAKWNADDAEHLRYEYNLKPDDVVFDIGSYRGEWSAEIYKRYGCRIIGIDPTPHNTFQHFERFINEAASDYAGRMSFGGAYYYSSAYENPVETYPCFDLNVVLFEYPEIALIKLNVEGAEYDLLRDMILAGLHLRVKRLQVQFHEVEGIDWKNKYNVIAGNLAKTHSLTFRFPFCWESWRRNELP
jgi:FkbM family methyltransferase